MVSGCVTRLENLQVGGGVGIRAEDFWGDHTVLRGNRGGGISRRHKIDCQITTNKGGEGVWGHQMF